MVDRHDLGCEFAGLGGTSSVLLAVPPVCLAWMLQGVVLRGSYCCLFNLMDHLRMLRHDLRL